VRTDSIIWQKDPLHKNHGEHDDNAALGSRRRLVNNSDPCVLGSNLRGRVHIALAPSIIWVRLTLPFNNLVWSRSPTVTRRSAPCRMRPRSPTPPCRLPMMPRWAAAGMQHDTYWILY
jgi:hypothetical protein